MASSVFGPMVLTDADAVRTGADARPACRHRSHGRCRRATPCAMRKCRHCSFLPIFLPRQILAFPSTIPVDRRNPDPLCHSPSISPHLARSQTYLACTFNYKRTRCPLFSWGVLMPNPILSARLRFGHMRWEKSEAREGKRLQRRLHAHAARLRAPRLALLPCG